MQVDKQTPATITSKGKVQRDYSIGVWWDEANQRWIFGCVFKDSLGFFSWTQMRYGSDYFSPEELLDPESRKRHGEDFYLDMGNEIVITVDEFVRALRELGLIKNGQ